MSTPALVSVSAGLGRPSSTRLLADRLTQETRQQLESAGRPTQSRTIELRELAGDIADHLVAGFPSERLREAIESVSEAAGVIAVTPVFNASYSGLFKSFFDLIDPTSLVGTPVLIGATGGTARHSLTLEHAMRPLFSYLRAIVVPTAVFAASEDWGSGGDDSVDSLSARTTRASSELAGLMAGQAAAPASDSGHGPDGVMPFAEQLAAVRQRV